MAFLMTLWDGILKVKYQEEKLVDIKNVQGTFILDIYMIILLPKGDYKIFLNIMQVFSWAFA
jgi:hypothetical protein